MGIVPLQVKFLHMRRMASLERAIALHVHDLQAQFGRVIGCHVFVEVPHRHKQSGNALEVRISLARPGQLVVTRKMSAAAQPATAIHQAFDALTRQLLKTRKKRVATRKRV